MGGLFGGGGGSKNSNVRDNVGASTIAAPTSPAAPTNMSPSTPTVTVPATVSMPTITPETPTTRTRRKTTLAETGYPDLLGGQTLGGG